MSWYQLLMNLKNTISKSSNNIDKKNVMLSGHHLSLWLGNRTSEYRYSYGCRTQNDRWNLFLLWVKALSCNSFESLVSTQTWQLRFCMNIIITCSQKKNTLANPKDLTNTTPLRIYIIYHISCGLKLKDLCKSSKPTLKSIVIFFSDSFHRYFIIVTNNRNINFMNEPDMFMERL